MEEAVKLWRIAEESEVFAARSEQEVREYYIKMVGKEEAAESFQCLFEQVPENELDAEFDFLDDDGEKTRTTLRKLAEGSVIIPNQVCSSYL